MAGDTPTLRIVATRAGPTTGDTDYLLDHGNGLRCWHSKRLNEPASEVLKKAIEGSGKFGPPPRDRP
jgi:hypothetical protein